MRIATICILALVGMGCAINQGMTVKRTAHYDASGRLTGYTVEETLGLKQVARPLDNAVPVEHFETGNTLHRQKAQWPPRGASRRATSLYGQGK